MSVFHNPALLGSSGSSGYKIERSLRFNSNDSAYLSQGTSRSPAANTSITFSFWLKLGSLAADQQILWSNPAAGYLYMTYWGSYASGALWVGNDAAGADANAAKSNGVLRDPSAWYHIVYSRAHSSNGILYINGVQQTTQAINTANVDFFADSARCIGRRTGGTRYGTYYLADFFCIDGQALTPSSFGETNPVTGVWQPKRYNSGTYGTNGFYLKFADNSGTTSTTLGKDSSGNGNNWTPNNFSVTAGAGNDSMIDTPTPYADGGNGRGNYCTLNPLANPNGSSVTITNGNLDFSHSSGTANQLTVIGTIGVNSGKWYYEYTVGSPQNDQIGITSGLVPGGSAHGGAFILYYSGDINNSGGSVSETPAPFTTGDVIGVAYDMGAATVYFYKNNSLQSTITGIGSFTAFAIRSVNTSATGGAGTFNFGQRPFAYTPPSGFLALNTQNLPEPTIKKPSSYMDVVTYTGTGATQTISSLGFSPDLIWTKSRSASANHNIVDAVRGVGNTLYSNTTNAEASLANQVTSFNSNGFTLGADTNGGTNFSGRTYVAWCWDESATPGFDIVTFTKTTTNQTFNHSLGVTPSMMIVKGRGPTTSNWLVYHVSANASPQNGGVALEQTSGFVSNTGYWNNTAPTSSQFTVGSFMPNESSVAYLWSEVAGFSKFGSYTGNGSSDGPFVYCGFRPRWILLKRTDSTSNWGVIDTSRDTYNATVKFLYPDIASAEGTGFDVDILSNGFKQRTTGGYNGSGATYIFCAFAETPAKYSLAR